MFIWTPVIINFVSWGGLEDCDMNKPMLNTALNNFVKVKISLKFITYFFVWYFTIQFTIKYLEGG